MSHAWTHSWCKSQARDEAVRAAEDNRPGPLPTLEEVIDAVTERRPPEPGGGGNVTGLRTERVTLEVTHDLDAPLGEWIVQVLDESIAYDESVRVVDEAHFDDLAQVSMERDAAMRERDTLRAERITQALTADRFAAAGTGLVVVSEPVDLDDLQRVGVLVREKTDDNWLADMVELACDEIARLREERRSISTLLGKVETLEADNKRLREERRWIPVGERLPTVQGEDVLTARGPWEDGGYSIVRGWWNGECWMFYGSDRDSPPVAFWQPLPPGPECEQ